MPPLFRLRRARHTNAEAIARVHVASWQAAYRDIIPSTTIEGFDLPGCIISWQRQLDSGVTVWVVTEDDLIVGFAEVRGSEVPVLYIHPGWWRLGLGSRLLRRALADIAKNGHRQAVIWVLADNAEARQFYGWHGGLARDRRTIRFGGSELAEVCYLFDMSAEAVDHQ
jgi:GNAT superfamily N-acetyltransferase